MPAMAQEGMGKEADNPHPSAEPDLQVKVPGAQAAVSPIVGVSQDQRWVLLW